MGLLSSPTKSQTQPLSSLETPPSRPNDAVNYRVTASPFPRRLSSFASVALEEEENDSANGDSEDTWTPLQLACLSGSLENVQELLSPTAPDGPADINAAAVGWYGQTALQAACARGHTEIIAYLLTYPELDIHAPGGNNAPLTAFQIACRYGDMEIVNLLLERGAHVNAIPPRYSGRDPLQAAAEAGHILIVGKLLALGGHINTPPSRYAGRTALQGAARRGHLDIVSLLLDGGADVNAEPSKYKGLTALQGACLGGWEAVAQMLIETGADVNAPGAYFEGGRALHAAAEAGYANIVRMLLDAGADINAIAGKGQTALMCAVIRDKKEVITLLEERGAVGSNAAGVFLFPS